MTGGQKIWPSQSDGGLGKGYPVLFKRPESGCLSHTFTKLFKQVPKVIKGKVKDKVQRINARNRENFC